MKFLTAVLVFIAIIFFVASSQTYSYDHVSQTIVWTSGPVDKLWIAAGFIPLAAAVVTFLNRKK